MSKDLYRRLSTEWGAKARKYESRQKKAVLRDIDAVIREYGDLATLTKKEEA
jgi:hypothetical protein